MGVAVMAQTGCRWLTGFLMAIALWLAAGGAWAGLAMGPPFTLDTRPLYARAGVAIGPPFELNVP